MTSDKNTKLIIHTIFQRTFLKYISNLVFENVKDLNLCFPLENNLYVFEHLINNFIVG